MIGSQKGSVMVIVITGITIIAAIGAGVASLVTSSARTGVNQSLSVQALYAAESGLEWAGRTLKKDFKDGEDWVETCEGFEDLSDEDTPDIGQASFTITGQEKTSPDGCEVTVTGWVGSDKDDPLAKRILVGKISKNFIENSGGIPGDADEYGGDGKGFQVKNGKTGYVEEDIKGNDKIEIKNDATLYVVDDTVIKVKVDTKKNSDIYFYNNVKVTEDIGIKGYAYFGDNFKTDGDITIWGEACFGENVIIDGKLELKNGANVCIKDDVEILDTIILNNDSQLCVGLDSDIDCDGIDKGQLCTEDDSCDIECSAGYSSECADNCDTLCVEPLTGSSNPVGTEDGNWSEGTEGS